MITNTVIGGGKTAGGNKLRGFKIADGVGGNIAFDPYMNDDGDWGYYFRAHTFYQSAFNKSFLYCVYYKTETSSAAGYDNVTSATPMRILVKIQYVNIDGTIEYAPQLPVAIACQENISITSEECELHVAASDYAYDFTTVCSCQKYSSSIYGNSQKTFYHKYCAGCGADGTLYLWPCGYPSVLYWRPSMSDWGEIPIGSNFNLSAFDTMGSGDAGANNYTKAFIVIDKENTMYLCALSATNNNSYWNNSKFYGNFFYDVDSGETLLCASATNTTGASYMQAGEARVNMPVSIVSIGYDDVLRFGYSYHSRYASNSSNAWFRAFDAYNASVYNKQSRRFESLGAGNTYATLKSYVRGEQTGNICVKIGDNRFISFQSATSYNASKSLTTRLWNSQSNGSNMYYSGQNASYDDAVTDVAVISDVSYSPVSNTPIISQRVFKLRCSFTPFETQRADLPYKFAWSSANATLYPFSMYYGRNSTLAYCNGGTSGIYSLKQPTAILFDKEHGMKVAGITHGFYNSPSSYGITWKLYDVELEFFDTEEEGFATVDDLEGFI